MKVLFLFFTLILFSTGAWASGQEGSFISVAGKVQSQRSGGKARTVQKGSTVREGDKIKTGPQSSAVVRFFDGSEITISPDSRVGISRLQKPSALDKILSFKLFFGKLLSQVQKLASAKSSFEVSAGGVVCGVRGTKFSMGYDPGKNWVTLDVFEGTVYGRTAKNKGDYQAGTHMDFINGIPKGPPPRPEAREYSFNGAMDKFLSNDQAQGPGALSNLLGGLELGPKTGIGGGNSGNGGDVLTLPHILLPGLGLGNGLGGLKSRG